MSTSTGVLMLMVAFVPFFAFWELGRGSWQRSSSPVPIRLEPPKIGCPDSLSQWGKTPAPNPGITYRNIIKYAKATTKEIVAEYHSAFSDILDRLSIFPYPTHTKGFVRLKGIVPAYSNTICNQTFPNRSAQHGHIVLIASTYVGAVWKGTYSMHFATGS